MVRSASPSSFERFWRPALKGDKPVLIFLPVIRSYTLNGDAALWEAGGGKFGENAPPDKRIAAGDMSEWQDKVGLGAAQGAVRLALAVTGQGGHVSIKAGSDMSFADLREGPVVLLGAFSSSWAMEMTRDLRFRFERPNGRGAIVDASSGKLWRSENPRPGGSADLDYALIARVLHPRSGQTVFLASGLTTYGTLSAAEFLSEPARIQTLVGGAPPGWESKNMEAVIRMRVVGQTPSLPELVAVYFW